MSNDSSPIPVEVKLEVSAMRTAMVAHLTARKHEIDRMIVQAVEAQLTPEHILHTVQSQVNQVLAQVVNAALHKAFSEALSYELTLVAEDAAYKIVQEKVRAIRKAIGRRDGKPVSRTKRRK